MAQYWLLKTEPGDYSWSDLKRDGETEWDGVKAPAARRNLVRMKPGDLVLIYHTGSERAVRGVAMVTGLPYPDAEQPHGGILVNVAWKRDLPRPVSLKEIKDSGLFPDWELVRLPRLSVVPVSVAQWQKVMEWSGANH